MSIEQIEQVADTCTQQPGHEGVAVNAAPASVVDWFNQRGCAPTTNPLVFCCPCGTGFPPQEVRGEDHMVGSLVMTNGNGQQETVASGGVEFIAGCRTVPANGNGNGNGIQASGMVIYPAGMAIGAGVSAGLGYLLAGALGYGGKNGALVGGGLSLAYSLYTNKKSTGSFFPSRDPMGNGGGNGTSGCGCG